MCSSTSASQKDEDLNVPCRIILSERISFASLLIIDPFLYPGPPEDLLKLRVSLVRQAHVRRDVWHSRKHAEIYLRETGAKGWDPRILKLYLVSVFTEIGGSQASQNGRNMGSGTIRMSVAAWHRTTA